MTPFLELNDGQHGPLTQQHVINGNKIHLYAKSKLFEEYKSYKTIYLWDVLCIIVNVMILQINRC